MSGEVESVAPSTTTEIAERVVEEFEPSESSAVAESPSGTDTPTESAAVPVGATPEPVAVTPAVVKQLTDEEKLLEEFGFKEAYKPDGREHYIPRSKVLKMIGSGLKRGSEKWTAERAEIEKQAQAYKADLDELYSDVRGEPKAFLEKIAQHDSRYRVLLEPPPAPPPAPAPALPMPQPDLTLQDGSRTYSIDGLQKLLEWNTAQVEAKLMPKLDERLKPYVESAKDAKAREAQEQADKSLHERTQRHMADLTKMPLFGAFPTDGSLTPFQQDVLKVLQADSAKARSEGRRPTMTPKEAYWEVAGPQLEGRLNESEGAKRERLLKEMSTANKATPTATRGGGETPKVGALTTADIARRTIEQLERE